MNAQKRILERTRSIKIAKKNKKKKNKQALFNDDMKRRVHYLLCIRKMEGLT